MEQQTISVAKAGIIATLNARTSGELQAGAGQAGLMAWTGQVLHRNAQHCIGLGHNVLLSNFGEPMSAWVRQACKALSLL